MFKQYYNHETNQQKPGNMNHRLTFGAHSLLDTVNATDQHCGSCIYAKEKIGGYSHLSITHVILRINLKIKQWYWRNQEGGEKRGKGDGCSLLLSQHQTNLNHLGQAWAIILADGALNKFCVLSRATPIKSFRRYH